MPKKPKKETIEDAVAQLDSVRREWLRRPGVTAVDVGFKISGDELTDDLALRVHVERKLPAAALPEHEVFTVSGETPEEVGGFPVDVIEASYGPAQVAAVEVTDAEAIDRRGVVSPIVGGISCGNPRITAGTVGAIVFDRTDCSAQILSNWHVLAGSGAAGAGEEIWQPGKADGGTSANTVATLNRFRLDRDMDAAIAKLTGARPHSRDLVGLTPITGVAPPSLGTQVVKSGRTTGVTEGVIDGVSLSLTLDYGGGTVNTFHDQIHIVPRPPWPSVDYEVSLGGDSGSVWIDESSMKAVGLHFAGETNPAPSAENAIANRMEAVAAGLKFSFLPLICLDPRPPLRRIPRDRLRKILCSRFPWLCALRPWAAPMGPFPRPGPWMGRIEPAIFGLDAYSGAPAGSWGGASPTAGGESLVDEIVDAIYEEMGW